MLGMSPFRFDLASSRLWFGRSSFFVMGGDALLQGGVDDRECRALRARALLRAEPVDRVPRREIEYLLGEGLVGIALEAWLELRGAGWRDAPGKDVSEERREGGNALRHGVVQCRRDGGYVPFPKEELEEDGLQRLNHVRGVAAVDLSFASSSVGVAPRRAAHTMSRRCLLYTSPSPRDKRQSRMPSSA